MGLCSACACCGVPFAHGLLGISPNSLRRPVFELSLLPIAREDHGAEVQAHFRLQLMYGGEQNAMSLLLKVTMFGIRIQIGDFRNQVGFFCCFRFTHGYLAPPPAFRLDMRASLIAIRVNQVEKEDLPWNSFK